MATIANLMVKIGADLTSLNNGLKQTESSLQQTASRMRAIGATMTVAVTAPIVAAGTAITKMAMDAQESENLFQVSMGNMADSARQWSEELRKQLGLNSYEIRRNVGIFNTMFTSMGLGEKASYDMSKGLTKLAYDMASFYNLNTEDAFIKLQAGISGETEPLKRLGILVDETTIKQWAMTNGLIKQGQELSQQQKVLARYGAIMDATAKAQGDLARTIDSPANKLRILKSNVQQTAVELGNNLLPIFAKTLDAINKAVTWFSKLDGSIKNAIMTIAGLAAVIGPVLLTFSALAPAIAALGTPLGATIAGVGLLTAALIYLYNTNEDIRIQFNSVFNDIQNTMISVGNEMKTFWDQWGNEITAVFNFVFKSATMQLEIALEQVKVLIRAVNLISEKNFAGAAGALASLPYQQLKVMDRIEKRDQLRKYKWTVPGQSSSSKTNNDIAKWSADMDKAFNAAGNTGAKVYDSLADKVKEFITAIKDQTNAYMNFVGLFDKANSNMAISGERWLNRLKGQLVAMQTYQQSVAVLQSKAQSGVISSALFEQLKAMGPAGAKQLQAVAKMSDTQLREASGLYGQRLDISQEMAYNDALSNRAKEKALNQIVINITGNNFTNEEEVDRLLDKAIQKLSLAGYDSRI